MRIFKIVLSALIVTFLVGLISFLIFAPSYVERRENTVVAHANYPVSPEAQKLHDRLIIGDWHADSLLWKRDLLERSARGQVDIPRLVEGNVALQMFTAVTKMPRGHNYHENSADSADNITLLAMGQMWPRRTWNSLFDRAVYQSEKLHRFAGEPNGGLKIIKTRADLEKVLAARKADNKVLGALLGIEGAHALEGDIENLDRLRDAGFRLVGLQHFFDNELGGSLHGQQDQGLSDFGRQVVNETQDNSMILDVAHSSPRVIRDVLNMVDMPVIISHTGIHSNCPVKRNISDELIKGIAETGGVIGIGFWGTVTCDDTPYGVSKTIAAAIDLVGEDHVSLGSDFDGSVQTALDVSELAAITHELLARGLSDHQISKVMGENMVRVLQERLPE